jgi:hypothetical protein
VTRRPLINWRQTCPKICLPARVAAQSATRALSTQVRPTSQNAVSGQLRIANRATELKEFNAAAGQSASAWRWLEHAQEIKQVQLVLWAQDQAEALLIKMHDVKQGRSRAVMEVGGSGGKAAQDRSLDLAGMGELAIN